MSQVTTLCFCVGATKASTTWLFKFLSGHPDCHLRSIKELHFFDSLQNGSALVRARRLQRSLNLLRADESFAAAFDQEARIQDLEEWLPALTSGSEAAYLDYLQKGKGARHLIADVTPSYGLLPVDRLRKMAALLPDVRFVYLMRDPVARLWSHVRMSARRQGGDYATRAAQVFDSVLSGQDTDVTIRGDYVEVLARLDAAIDPARLLVMFQEVLMTVPGVQKLCAFLGIAPQTANFSQRVHKGRDLEMTTLQLARARVALRPQYEFAAARFGTLPEAWLRNMGEGVA